MQQLISLFREIILRIFSHESPELFKKIQWFSGIITGLITVLLIGNSMFDWGWGLITIVHISLTQILSGIVLLLGGIFGASTVPVKDTEKLSANLKKSKSKIEP